MSKKRESEIVKTLSLREFEKLTAEINNFRDGVDLEFDDDSLEIEIYDDGHVVLNGRFSMSDSRRLDI